jgi:hypothetical protein
MKLRMLDGPAEDFPYIVISEGGKVAIARANEALHTLGKTYHDGLPIPEISEILAKHGMSAEGLSGIYCGEQGSTNAQVGTINRRSLYLHLNWYKMPSGRFEIVAYIN